MFCGLIQRFYFYVYKLNKDCFYCDLLVNLNNRRFYYDGDDFVIIDNLSSLTPLLICKKHTINLNVKKIIKIYTALNLLCGELFGIDYYLKPDLKHGHFAVSTGRILHTYNFFLIKHNSSSRVD